mmetsp:Transcript_5164/g.18637  ORF Transcript_5164/g.18637 Transcript_5164/m.18637 type:complete len:330 (-) Transcript_5164:599-1588(-)
MASRGSSGSSARVAAQLTSFLALPLALVLVLVFGTSSPRQVAQKRAHELRARPAKVNGLGRVQDRGQCRGDCHAVSPDGRVCARQPRTHPGQQQRNGGVLRLKPLPRGAGEPLNDGTPERGLVAQREQRGGFLPRPRLGSPVGGLLHRRLALPAPKQVEGCPHGPPRQCPLDQHPVQERSPDVSGEPQPALKEHGGQIGRLRRLQSDGGVNEVLQGVVVPDAGHGSVPGRPQGVRPRPSSRGPVQVPGSQDHRQRKPPPAHALDDSGEEGEGPAVPRLCSRGGDLAHLPQSLGDKLPRGEVSPQLRQVRQGGHERGGLLGVPLGGPGRQ